MRRSPRTVIVGSAAVLVAGLLMGSCLGQDQKTTFTEIRQAGEDYQVQGEYGREIKLQDGKSGIGGYQIIALGGGKFRAVAHLTGLPGEGAKNKEPQSIDGELKDGAAKFLTKENQTLTINGERATLVDAEGNKADEFKKLQRQSPTLGMKPPKDAVVLFDGSSADKFNGGKMTDDKLLMVGCTTKQAFGSFTMHLEFRTPFMPYARGQARGNSGLYLQDRYELQILDSFGLKGLNNECGGFYSQRDPDVNMCLPPLVWQTYDIDFQAARFDGEGKKISNAMVTVRHNGQVIHDAFELPGPTPGGKSESDKPGPLQLQNHGNPVHFRNVWVLSK